MEITSVHKYIALNKMANGTVEVMFAGQPCLTIFENAMGSFWKINPVFAKLVYGANIFEDIPQCNDDCDSTEIAIAAGLVKLHELGAFTTEVDFPEDSYASTLNTIAEDVKAYSLKNSKTLLEAFNATEKIMKSVKNNTFQMKEAVDAFTQRSNLRNENKLNINANLVSEISNKEKEEEKEVVSALKKDKKFISKADKNSNE